jgi:hypothetical protein
LTLGEMQARVSQRLAEGATGPVYYPAAEITAALNEADRLFVLLTLGLERTTTWSVTAATPFFHMLTVFPDWIAPLRIRTATGAKVRPARLEDLTSLDPGWMAQPGAPVRYAALGADFLAVYPQPAQAVTLTVTYARSPVAMVSPAATPETPAEYHPIYVDYAVNRLRQVEGGQEFQKSLPYLGSFMQGASRYAGYVRARNLGSRYDKLPYELELFDRSAMLGLRSDVVPARKAGG